MRTRAWLELARISNLPTVWSNVAAGTAIGMAGAGTFILNGSSVARMLGVMAGASLLYVGGMALNDVIDARTDRDERPGRPIPSGRVSRGAAFVFAAACLAGGIGVGAATGLASLVVSVVLAGMIVAYDLVHDRSGWSVMLMGACRGLVYVLAASAVGGDAVWSDTIVPAGCLAGYTAGLSVIARGEVGGGAGGAKAAAVLMPVPMVVLVLSGPGIPGWPVVVAGIIGLAWVVRCSRLVFVRPARTIPAVLGLIAGFCLVDVLVMTLTVRGDAWMLVGVSLVGFGVAVWGHRRVAGT